MSPVETLREAARLLREQAEAATPGPWRERTFGVFNPPWAAVESSGDNRADVCWAGDGDHDGPSAFSDAAYIAAMHPGVALAVADWLNAEAESGEQMARTMPRVRFEADVYALAVARVYLGEAS